MSKQSDWVVEMIAQIVQDSPTSAAPKTAEIIVERLKEEGLLHIGHGNADIDKVVVAFADSFGTTRTSKYDRYAARRLVAKYGTDSVCGIIKMLAEKSGGKYYPVVNDISQLERKFVSVLNFLRSDKKTDGVVDA